MLRIIGIAFCLLALSASYAQARRVALVIGNNDYQTKTSLTNAVNDAREVSKAFRELGFELIGQRDGNMNQGKDQMRALLNALRQKAAGAEAAVFYYAGHGYEGFLIPVDAKLEFESDLILDAVPVDMVLSVVSRATIGIAVLDACRNTDFPLKREDGSRRGPGAQRGMVRRAGADRTYVAYSAEEGQSAADGVPGGLSPFAAAFLRNVKTPGQDINATFGNVQEEVRLTNRPDASEGQRQVPISMNKLGNAQFFFNPSGPRAPTIAQPPASVPVPQVTQTGPTQADEKIVTGSTFRDCADCPEMVALPTGQFAMGSPDNEGGRDNDESPQHNVQIKHRLAVAKFEVTFAEWDNCVASGGCNAFRPADRWGRERQPAINVKWSDTQAYVGWLSKKTGKRYRLLSEAEWEYAARAGTTGRYPWGADADKTRANFRANKTVTVGSYPANAFGLHDMIGNAWEWVEDCWHDRYTGAPTDGSPWTTGECSKRVIRGGSWWYWPLNVRSADRNSRSEASASSEGGIRIARTLEQ